MDIKQEEVWDNIAIKWDQFRYKTSKEVRDFLKGKKGKILDIGCGSGRNFVKIKNLNWYGCDFSSKMILLADKRAKEREIAVDLKKGDTDNLPYEENYFENVLLYAVLHCVENEKKRINTIREVYRVLKKNGLAFISVWGRNSQRLSGKVNETIVPWTINGVKYERYTYIFKKEELEKMLKDAGFKIEKFWEDENLNFIVRK